MGKFDAYKVDLKGMRQDVQTLDYLLDNQYFANIEGEDISKGKINATVIVKRINDGFDLNFKFVGTAVISCDRCLDDMDFPIDATAHLIVKFGKDYSEESDEIVIIPETEGVINLAWFLYEFVALTIPIKHTHAPGKCNKEMSEKLKSHTVHSSEEEVTDPRWDVLKELDLE